jgi:hypothetical protein
MTKVWITLFTATAILVGCKPIQPTNSPSPDLTPEDSRGTPTETYTPTEGITATLTIEPTVTIEPTATKEIVNWINSPEDVRSQYSNELIYSTEYVVVKEVDHYLAKAKDEIGEYIVYVANYNQEKKGWVWGPVPWDMAFDEMETSASGPRFDSYDEFRKLRIVF